jgi:5-methylcytosine-specific restriction endonuclease McrA
MTSADDFFVNHHGRPDNFTLRQRLRDRDGDNCGDCNKRMVFKRWAGTNPDEATLDHRRPRSHEGTYDLENLRLLCSACNKKRGTRDCPACAAGTCTYVKVKK